MKLVKILAYNERQVIKILGSQDEASTAEFKHGTRPNEKYINPDHIMELTTIFSGFLTVRYANGEDLDHVILTIDEAKALFEF